MIKIVYFDEGTASDYINISNGGKLDWTSGSNKEKLAKIVAEIDAKVGGGFNFLSFIKAQASSSVNSDISGTTNKMFCDTLSNTILTDYIDTADSDSSITKFKNALIYPPKESITIYKMYSPYTVIMPKDVIPIDLTKLNEALESAKGYYEMVIDLDGKKSILRFNNKAFRNNYNLCDLPKMNLTYHAIKVGCCSAENLNMENEFDFTQKKPTSDDILGTEIDEKLKDLFVYDVILAGVILE